ncbi:MAG: transposase [Chromatiales bacterium]
MARYKHYDYHQHKLIPISFAEQILPSTFEYTLNYLIDHEVDLWVFEARYCNDETAAPAYDPAILLKVILYAYSRGVLTSREIERLYRKMWS